jgi:hypothetical protein
MVTMNAEDTMKTNMNRWGLLAGALACALVMTMSTGCEDAETGSGLTLDPPSADLTGQGATVSLTASMPEEGEEVILPLTWSVSNPSMGGILRSAGYTAVYESNGRIGQNVVICRDGLGREGLASVNQR